MLGGEQTAEEFCNSFRGAIQATKQVVTFVKTVVDIVKPILEFGAQIKQFIDTIKGFLNVLTPVNSVVTVLDFLGFTKYKSDNIVGFFAELAKLLKKLGYYIPIKETVIDFVKKLSKLTYDESLKVQDIFDQTSNPETTTGLFDGLRKLADGKNLGEAFADFTIGGINPVQTMKNIEKLPENDQSIENLVNCLSDGKRNC